MYLPFGPSGDCLLNNEEYLRSPVIKEIIFVHCIYELSTSNKFITATDPAECNLYYKCNRSDFGNIILAKCRIWIWFPGCWPAFLSVFIWKNFTLDVQIFSVIPATAGMQKVFQPPVDSGSPLRSAWNDGYRKAWSQKNLIIELQTFEFVHDCCVRKGMAIIWRLL